MRYVKFGSSDMMVSEACLGTMMWPSFTTDEQEIFAQFDLAIRKGVNFIDTAEMYPVPCAPHYMNATEVVMGKWLKARTTAGDQLTFPDGTSFDRSKVYIATKACGDASVFGPLGQNFRAVFAGREDPCGARPQQSADLQNGPSTEHTAEQLLKACQASIERLQCDYIDLYQLHWPNRYAPCFGSTVYRKEKEYKPDKRTSPEAFDAIVLGLKALFDKNLIKNWGLSNETCFGIMSFVAACDRNGVPRPVSVQNDVSLVNRGFETELAEVCTHYDIAGLPYGALAGGTLSGKYDNRMWDAESGKYVWTDPETGEKTDTPPADAQNARHQAKPNFQSRYHCESTVAASRKYSALAKRHGLKPVTLAVAWMNQQFWNTSVITGSTSAKQLEEYLDAFDVELSPEILKEIDLIHAECRNPNIED